MSWTEICQSWLILFTVLWILFEENSPAIFCISKCKFSTSKCNQSRWEKFRPSLSISVSANQIREYGSSQSLWDTVMVLKLLLWTVFFNWDKNSKNFDSCEIECNGSDWQGIFRKKGAPLKQRIMRIDWKVRKYIVWQPSVGKTMATGNFIHNC